MARLPSSLRPIAARDVEADPIGPGDQHRHVHQHRSVDDDGREGDVGDEGEHRVAILPGERAVRVHQPRRRLRRSPLRSLRRDLAAAETALRLPSAVSRKFDLVEREVAEREVEAERGHARREMVGQFGGDVDLAPVRMVDPEPPRVEMQLAADRAGQEGVRARHICRRRRSGGRSRACGRAAGGCGR